MLITSNLVFSKWDQIFKDTMTTAAAVNRVVHHSVILELNIDSYRAQAAKKRTAGEYLREGKLTAPSKLSLVCSEIRPSVMESITHACQRETGTERVSNANLGCW